MEYHTLFFRKVGTMSQYLTSAALKSLGRIDTKIGPVARKFVFLVWNKARLKPSCSATNISKNSVFLLLQAISFYLTKVLIRLRRCACSSVALFLTCSKVNFFSRRGPFEQVHG